MLPQKERLQINVLDRGFVKLLDVMGSDQEIVDAARVLEDSSRGEKDDTRLIRYMLIHEHFSPFEMAEVKFIVKAPLFVTVHMLRHRTACLSGDTYLHFDLPGAKSRTTGAVLRRSIHKKTIYDFFVAWNKKREDGSLNLFSRSRLARMNLRMCNEETGEIEYTKVTDIWETGVKPVYCVKLANGISIKATKDHLFLTDNGWLTLEQAVSLRHSSSGTISWESNSPLLATNGCMLHQSKEWLASKRAEGLDLQGIASQAGVSTHCIRKWLKKFDLQYSMQERAVLAGKANRGRSRTMTKPYVMTEARWAGIKRSRSGAQSHFWKGGITGERALIGVWSRNHAVDVHKKYNYRCIICNSGYKLHAHHIDPVWHNEEKGRDIENLVTLCRKCHNLLHANNLELLFFDDFTYHLPMKEFFLRHSERETRPTGKRLQTVNRLVRVWSKIEDISFVGEEMTYDLAVSGPYHNFVANGFIVHNSINMFSQRYSVVPNEFYVPEAENLNLQSHKNHQSRSEEVLDTSKADSVIEGMRAFFHEANTLYDSYIAQDMAKELSRIVLPQAVYTQFVWKMDLRNLLHFLHLRLAEEAQYETRRYAEAMYRLIQPRFPITCKVWEETVRHAVSLTADEVVHVRSIMEGGPGYRTVKERVDKKLGLISSASTEEKKGIS